MQVLTGERSWNLMRVRGSSDEEKRGNGVEVPCKVLLLLMNYEGRSKGDKGQ